KRRRSRRRRPKGDTTDVKTSPESDSEADASGDEDDMDDMDADDMADVMDGDGHSDKSGHRSIPVWQDAISIVIEKNLESRAKKPDGGGQQKRGGRRSGRRGRG
ncbi:MAG: hypothetical protein U1E05_09235, partial [Patescibacteria group bacterium]|nr:hypothetical protein [Patescibacteria group bacterium]